MALTTEEKQSVLDIFGTTAAIKNSDQLLMLANNNLSGQTTPGKITAEVLRAYLMKGVEVTIGDDGYLYIGGIKTTTEANSLMMVPQTLTTVGIDPNVLNVWGAIASLAVSFNAGSSGRVSEYMLEFTVSGDNFTLTLPNGTRWVEEPDFEAGNTYQVSVLNGLAIYAEWEAAES